VIGHGFSDHIAQFYNKTALKFLLKRADKIITIQEGYADFSPHLSEYKDKITVVPCGVETDKFLPASISQENTIFFLSVLDQFHKYKGLDYLLKALKIVKKEINNVKLIVGGKGSLLNYYQKMAESLGLKDNVEFHGFIPEDKMVEYYNNCNVFVLPSISSAQEGFGIVALEALSCQRPVIITEIVGISEDMKSENAGIVVPSKNTVKLANAIIDVLTDKDLQQDMGKCGRRLVENNYTWKRVAKMTEDIYKEVLE